VQYFANSFDYRGTHETGVPVGGLRNALQGGDQRRGAIVSQTPGKGADGLCLAYLDALHDQVAPNDFHAGRRADLIKGDTVRVTCRKLCVVKLLRRGLGDVAIHRGIGRGLLHAIGLHDLTGDLLDAPKHRGGGAMLAVNDGPLAALERRNDDGREL